MKTVLLASPFAPPELVAAFGLEARGLLPSLAGGGEGLEQAGLCPYARSLACTLAQTPADAIVLASQCDQQRRLGEWLAGQTDAAVFFLHVPAAWQSPAAGRLFADELARLGRFLVRLGGHPPSDAALTAMMRRYGDARAALRALAGTAAPPAFAAALHTYQTAPDAWLTRASVQASLWSPHAPAVRATPLALVGGPLLAEEFALFEQIGAMGGRIVLDATDSGERMLPGPFDRRRLAREPWAVLAEAYFALPAVFRRPNDALYRWLGPELARRGVRGIVLRRFVWCDLWHAELPRLRDWAGLPVLDLEIDGLENAAGRWASRIEPFLEMLT